MGTATKQQNKVPELRFSGFSDNWKHGIISDVLTVRSGRDHKNLSDGAIPVFGTGGLMRCVDEYLYNGKTVFIGRKGTINKPFYYEGKFWTVDTLFYTNEFNGVTPEFMFRIFNNVNWLKYNEASGVPSLSRTTIGKVPITVPEVVEQQKIADFLGVVDDWLDNLRSQKTALQTYKQGMMQKLFSQQVRFKDESGKDFPDWEDKELGDMLGYKQPTEFIVESTEYSDEYKTPVLTAGKTFILGYTDETKGIFDYELPVIIFDDFTTATQFVDFEFKVKSSAMKILVPLDGNNVKFLYEAMQLIRFEIGGHGRHWISKYSKLTVATPSLEEQNRIADFVIALDESIEAKVEEVAKVEQWKKGLMQKMFV